MPGKMKIWSAEQLKQMNEERFLIEMLDMLTYTPTLDGTDETEKKMEVAIHHVENALRARLAVKRGC